MVIGNLGIKYNVRHRTFATTVEHSQPPGVQVPNKVATVAGRPDIGQKPQA